MLNCESIVFLPFKIVLLHMKIIKIGMKMKLLTIVLSLVFWLIIVFLRSIHVDVFSLNSLVLTFLHYSIIEMYMLVYLSMLLLMVSQVLFRLLCCSLQTAMNILLCVLPLLLALEPFSLFRRLYASMFNQFYIDLAITLREILFSSFWHF